MTARTPRTRPSRVLAAHWILATTLPTAALAEAAASDIQAGQQADRRRAKPATVAQVQFNPAFLSRANGTEVDVSRYERGSFTSPGDYPVDIYVNGAWVGRETVQFRWQDQVVAPCMNKAILSRLKLDEQALPPANRNAIAQAVSGECVAPSAIADDVTWAFNLNDLRLDFSVAQALLRQAPRGTVSLEQLDEGVPSATLSYNANTFHTTGQGAATSTYLGLDGGLNIGGWHFRQRSAMTWQSHGKYDYQNVATYLQRDLMAWRSQVTLGDAFTDGAVFDSFSVRGVNLASDDRMLPDSARGYAPLIRGVARSNAKVTVTQEGNRIYETTVAPGPFEINDLYATGYGGNLLVTVTEADGSQSSFTVPYASLVQLLRPGTTRYSATVGEYRNGSTGNSGREKLAQGTVQYGINNMMTGYAGLVVSENYQAGLLGAAFNTPIGAVAVDATHARTKLPNRDVDSGQSVRISYSKFVPTTSTNLTLAAYRYATKGYWSMRDAFAARDGSGNVQGVSKLRSQVQLTMSQSLGDRWGNFYVTGTSTSYWSHDKSALMFQAGYSNSMRLFGSSVTYNVSASRQREWATGRYNTQVFVNLVAPLGRSPRAPLLSFGASHATNGPSAQQVTLNGTAFEDSSVSYGLNANRSGDTMTGGGNVQYRSPYATVSASASGGSGYTQYSGGMQGALVAHPGGVTLANYLGDTIGIVEAKGASGARVMNAPGTPWPVQSAMAPNQPSGYAEK